MNKLNNKGFTLIELLATLAVLSLVITIVIYISTNVISNAKEKSYQVTINNIEKQANAYVIENKDNLHWLKNSDTSEYQCVTIQKLIDKGYFGNDVLLSEIKEGVHVSADDAIYLERDSNKTITQNILLTGEYEGYKSLCSSMKTDGNISFSIHPTGWSKQKNIKIYYNILNNIDKVSNYKYHYEFYDATDIENFDKTSITKEIDVHQNGTLNAKIYDKDDELIFTSSLEIKNIDNDGPIIKENYQGNSVVKKTVTIPLEISDNNKSGVNSDTFGLGDISVTIGGTKITNLTLNKTTDNKYDLKINNTTNEGKVIITIGKDNFFDNLGNGNEEITLKPNVSFSITYNINYYLGKDIIKTTECKYNQNCTLTSWASLNKTFPNTSNLWAFNGWSESSSNTDTNYNNNQTFVYNKTDDINIYAIGKRTFNFYSGLATTSIKSTQIQYWNTYSNTTTSINTPQSTAITYWEFIGYRGNNVASSTVSLAENSEVTPKYNEFTSTDFRSIYKRTLSVKYNANGGTGTTASSTEVQYYNSGYAANGKNIGANKSSATVNLSESGFAKTGYTFQGWGTSSSATSATYQPGDSYTTNTDKTLYAVWKIDTYTIKYDANGGIDAPSSQTKTHDIALTLSSTKPTRTGYTFQGWGTSSSATSATYQPGDSYTTNTDKTLYAVWKINTVTIKYNANGGSITSSAGGYTWSLDGSGLIKRNNTILTTVINYGGSTNSDGLPNYNNTGYINISKTGYIVDSGAEWKCISGCTKVYSHSGSVNASDFCDASQGNCEVTLAVNWKRNFINKNMYYCSYINGENRLQIYFVNYCENGICYYDQKYNLDAEGYKNVDDRVTPTWSIEESKLSDTIPESGCDKFQYYTPDGGTKCYLSVIEDPDSIVDTFGSYKCSNFIKGLYITTVKTTFEGTTHSWYYDSKNNCYIPRSSLQKSCNSVSGGSATSTKTCICNSNSGSAHNGECYETSKPSNKFICASGTATADNGFDCRKCSWKVSTTRYTCVRDFWNGCTSSGYDIGVDGRCYRYNQLSCSSPWKIYK